MDDPRAPPASKEVVSKLPVITLSEEILVNLGQDAECAICKEDLVVGDKMQELPCKHKFHPPCLKPWLVKIAGFCCIEMNIQEIEFHNCTALL